MDFNWGLNNTEALVDVLNFVTYVSKLIAVSCGYPQMEQLPAYSQENAMHVVNSHSVDKIIARKNPQP